MSDDTNNMDLGDFESKVDQMAAMLNQLQEAGRQGEAVNKLKQLMNTLVKVCPESVPAPAVDESGDHVREEEGVTEGESHIIVQSILKDLVDQSVEGCGMKGKRLSRARACKSPAVLDKDSSKPSGLVKKRRGRPPKHLQAAIRAEKMAKRKELAEGKHSANSGGVVTRRGRKRKNPNPQKLSVDDSDEGEQNLGETQEQHTEDYVCPKCKNFNTKSVSKYIRHMRLHNEALLSCLSCQKDMFCVEEFQRHQCAKAPASPVKRQPTSCTMCPALFFSKKKFREHMKTQHNVTATSDMDSRPQLKCQYCEKTFNRKLSLFTHYKEHAGERWVCQTCGDFCDDFDAYSSHMAKHAKEAKFNCDRCSLSFQRKQQYEQHLSAHAKYDCDKCKRNFSTKKDLQRHERNEHGSKVPWEHKYHQCDICGKSFPRPGMLEVHRRIHTGEKPLECTACKMFFRTPKALSKHRQTFTHMQRSGNAGKERRYLCSLCGKAYFRRQALLRHQKYHTGEKPYKCPHCEYRCPEANNLKRHMLLHFSSQRSFMCEICGASFHAKKTLEMHHVYKHSEDRLFPCSECAMSFKAANALRRHLRSHSTEKPFACWCGASFNRQYNLRRHMKSVHGTDEALPPVRKVTVLDTPPEELAAKAEAEKETTKTKGKRGRKSKHNLQAATGTASQVQPLHTVSVETHPQHIVITAPQHQQHQITTEMTDQEIQQHVMASLPRVIEDQAMINSHLQHQEVHIQHVQLTEVHVQHPELETQPQTVPTHVIVSAQDTHSMTSSPVSRPMSVPHPGYGVTGAQQQWHMPIIMPTQVVTSQHMPLDQDQQQQQPPPPPQPQHTQPHHVSRSDTPTSQPSQVSIPIATRHVRQGVLGGGSLVHDRPMSHPSAQSISHHQQPQMHVPSHSHHNSHSHHVPPPTTHQQASHLQTTHHITYPEVTYSSTDTAPKHMVLIPSIAPGTEVVSPPEEQFLAKAEQVAMENMAQYQPGGTGYTGLPILLHQINTTN